MHRTANTTVPSNLQHWRNAEYELTDWLTAHCPEGSGDSGVTRKMKVKVLKAGLTSTLLYGACTYTDQEETQTKMMLESAGYCLACHMLHRIGINRPLVKRAKVSLGVTLPEQMHLRRPTRLLAMEDSVQPKTIMLSQMAKGRSWGWPHFQWSDKVKASLPQAGLLHSLPLVDWFFWLIKVIIGCPADKMQYFLYSPHIK